MKLRKLLLTFLLITMYGLCDSCKSNDPQPESFLIDCSSATFSTSAINGATYNGTAQVPYTGGVSESYLAGSAIASTGVTGLTATLQAGTLTTAGGNLVYSISGTPSSTGNAIFAITFGSQSCSISLPVVASTTNTISQLSSANVLKVIELANAFKATLSASQLTSLQLEYSKANAINWSNLPQALVQKKRVGIAFSTLNSTQLAAAKALLQEAAGNDATEGYNEISDVLLADDYLSANGGGGTYGAGNYYMAFLGTPAATGTWEFQFGGHHLAMANTYRDGAIYSATPHFEAVEPTSFTTGGRTIQVMGNEQAGMVAMLASLNSTQLAAAKLSTSLTDIVIGPGKDGQFPTTKSGLSVNSLSADQKQLVLAAMKPWVLDVDESTASALLKIYEGELNQTYISYSGTASANSNGDYVRIDGPSVWIEFSAQRGIVFSATHYHTIWRDRLRDYGANFSF